MTRAWKWKCLALFVGVPFEAHAGTVCDYYRDSNKTLYETFCGKTQSTKPAGSQSTFSESFSLNSASLPTEPSSYGLETIYTVLKKHIGQGRGNVGIVKGFKKLGTGLSTSENNTFYNNDVLRRRYRQPDLEDFTPYESPKTKRSNLNIASAVNLFNLSESLQVKLGGAVKYNHFTDTWGGGPALLVASPWLSMGAGLVREKIASDLPRINFLSTLVSLRFFILDLEYNRWDTNDPFKLAPIHIFSAGLRLKGLSILVAAKRVKFSNYGWVTQHHISLQYLVGKRFSVGIMDNYIPGTRSVGMQLFL